MNITMTKKSGYFKMPGISFKAFECYDLNVPTPKSTRVQRKLFTCPDPEQTIPWNKLVSSKYSFDVNRRGSITPPIEKSSTQPCAPNAKSNKYLSKIDLKPKKLIFKDIEESELDTIHFPVIFRVKSDNKIPERIIESEKESGNDRRIKRNRRKNANDDKENHMKFLLLKSKTNLDKASNISSLSRQNFNVNGGLKHFRL